MQLTERPVPCDIPAERSLLGSCLLEREAILGVRSIVSVADFYLQKHAWIYEAMLDCVAQRIPPDLSTVASELRRKQRLEEIGGLTYLGELVAECPMALHAPHYARSIARSAAHRRLIELGGRITASAYDESADPDALYRELIEQVQLEQRCGLGADNWQDMIRDGRDRWSDSYEQIPFVVAEILPPGTFLLSGKPKTKKSWLALNIAYAVASGGRALGAFPALRGDVLYIDLEMGDRRISQRLKTVFPTEPPPRGVQFATEWPRIGEGFFEQMERYLEMRPFTRLIVIDTMVRIRPRRNRLDTLYEQDSDFTQAITSFFEGRGIAVLLIHHSRKADGSDALDDASGSTGITGGVDNFGSLRRSPDDPKRGGILMLAGRDIIRDDDVLLRWDPMLVQWNYVTQSEAATLILSPEREAVVNLLQQRPGLRANEIATILDREQGSTRRLLSDMLRDKQISNAQGVYFAERTEILTA